MPPHSNLGAASRKGVPLPLGLACTFSVLLATTPHVVFGAEE